VVEEGLLDSLRVKKSPAGRFSDQAVELVRRLERSELDQHLHGRAVPEAVASAELIGWRRLGDSMDAQWRALRGVRGDERQLEAADGQLAQAEQRRSGAVAEERIGLRSEGQQRCEQVAAGRHRRARVGVDGAARAP